MKAIVFDLGKVLVDFDYGIAARRIAARSRATMDIAQFFIEHSPVLYRYEVGLINTEQFYEDVRERTGFLGDLQEFGQFFGDIFTPIPPMVELHASFRRVGFPTFIFSNTNELAIGHISTNFSFYANFDAYVLSYKEGAMKPDGKIYEAVERETRCAGDDILYIDDRPENIATGVARGWRTICHESPEKTQAAVVKLGLLPETAPAK